MHCVDEKNGEEESWEWASFAANRNPRREKITEPENAKTKMVSSQSLFSLSLSLSERNKTNTAATLSYLVAKERRDERERKGKKRKELWEKVLLIQNQLWRGKRDLLILWAQIFLKLDPTWGSYFPKITVVPRKECLMRSSGFYC